MCNATTYRGQQLYADTLVHYIETQQASDCAVAAAANNYTNYWTPATQTAADAPLIGITTTELEALTCHGHTPLSAFDAADTATFNSSVTFTTTAGTVSSATAARNSTAASQHEDWNIRADKQDKPGYIASGMSHSVLTARMHCTVSSANSKHVTVAVSYLKSYAGVGAVHVYGKQHNHIGTAISSNAAPTVNLRGSHHKRQLQISTADSDHGSNSERSSHVIDALDSTQHASPYQTKYMKLDHTYFTEGASSAVVGSTQSLEINFELLSAVDVPLIESIKAAAASRSDSNADTSNDSSEYSDAVRQDWKFKLVRLSCC
jgi:hypothetical protein